MAGLSVGAMVIPQGMSYANLAGLPYVFGLYGAFVPCLVYSLFGSSRQLAVGPVAVSPGAVLRCWAGGRRCLAAAAAQATVRSV